MLPILVVHPALPFQSTLPRRERQYLQITIPIRQQFQSTLPRRERRSRHNSTQRGSLISIHAPAKGATVRDQNMSGKEPVFQSTLPRRERHSEGKEIDYSLEISIHAPAKGATKHTRIITVSSAISIHAPAKGAT